MHPSSARRIAGAAAATAIAATTLVAGAVSARFEPAASEPADHGRYTATIARDDRGVPHITADDWGSMAFGQGYALAEDRVCTLLDQIVKVRGERARWYGAGEHDEHVDSDFAYRHLGLWEDAPKRWEDQSERVRSVIDGYTAGVNAAIDAGATGGQWCGGAGWVGPISTQDLYAWVSDILLLASSRNLLGEIGAAQPPETSGPASTDAPATEAGLADLRAAVDPPVASNGWALGADRSSTGGGLLLGNPHFPWEGELRFWESHLTIPGELNIYGVGLTGLPGVQIGFNDAVAWTHTVSAGHRLTIYRYDLDPTDPTAYVVDGEVVPMESSTYTIEVADDPAAGDAPGADDVSVTELVRTLYRTKHGPVIDVAPLGWSAEQALAIGDANVEITTVLEQYVGMSTAGSMDEFQQVHAEHQGVPWVNTISVSADGRAWIVDTSATPNISDEAIAAWDAELDAGGLIALAYEEIGIVMLDGSDSLFDWVDDPAAAAPGLIPFQRAPQLERGDYVFNANDSYWMSHPSELLTGFSPLQGAAETAQSPRTRTNVMLLSETDEPWTLADVQGALFSDRAILAELLREPLVEACTESPTVELDGGPFDLAPACDVLGAWDGTFTVDAVGAVLFREWLSRFDAVDRSDAGRLFADGFDPADPAGTPSTPVDERGDWLVELAGTVQLLELLGIAIDAPLGNVQWEIRSGDRIPLHGGTGVEGAANIIGCCASATVLGPQPDPGLRVNETSLLRDVPENGFGYPVDTGASFVLTVQYGTDGPTAEGFLTYGNPDDPADPNHRAGLEAFSASDWSPFAFTPDEVDAVTVDETTVTG